MKRRKLPNEMGVLGVVVLIATIFSIMSPAFRTLDNTMVLLINGMVIAFLALGQTFVLLTGGIDLSTGANAAMTGVIGALFIQAGLPWLVGAALAVGVGVVLGILNGLLIHLIRIPAFIATFSTQGVALAVPLILTRANSVPVTDPGFSWIGQGAIAKVPVPVLLLVICAVIAALFLKYTRAGVHVYAMGGNATAARLAGVSIARTTVLVYAVSGFCGGMAGILAASRLMVGFPTTGTGNELFYSIAAAVVGGISLFGGIGTVAGAMTGAVLIAIVSNGMNVLNVQSYWQSLVIGLIILAGVSLDTLRANRAGKPLFAKASPPTTPPSDPKTVPST